jgi:phosphoribosylformimino-5-aminoimidazole carboxamide ribotide isomerase
MPTVPFRVIPVLDLKGGQAVHAIAGRRAYYEPLESILHPAPDPIALARAYRDRLGLRTLYLADLDAIAGAAPSVPLYRELFALGLDVWIDAGVRDGGSLEPLGAIGGGAGSIVVGLETVTGPRALAEILDQMGPERVVFSLDLDCGLPRVAAVHSWTTRDAIAIATEAIGMGVRQLLLLDLAHVGTGRGLGTESLLALLRRAAPDVALHVGGGISTIDDVLMLPAAGAAGVLVSSALHDGRIGARELARLDPGPPLLPP